MDPIAFLVGPYSIYWSTVIQAMAALTGVLLFWFFYLWDERDCVGAFCVVPLAIGGAVVLGRLVHWYFRQDSYLSLVSALTDYSYGGFALMGCFAGVFLAAAVVALLRWGRHFGAKLDALSVAGAGAVGIGRLSGFCNTADRGQILLRPSFWGTELVNPGTGASEYRLATFLLQAAAAGVIFLVLTFLFFWRRGGHRRKPGDIFWLFCLYYGASQAVLDSTRYDRGGCCLPYGVLLPRPAGRRLAAGGSRSAVFLRCFAGGRRLDGVLCSAPRQSGGVCLLGDVRLYAGNRGAGNHSVVHCPYAGNSQEPANHLSQSLMLQPP